METNVGTPVDMTTMCELRQHHNLAQPDNTEKMFTFLRGFCSDKHNPKPQTMRALGYTRRKHHNQARDSGEPYIVHPLSMACFAIGLGLTDDDLIAVILLHDVCEDTKTAVEDLPVNDIVKHGVKYMTITEMPGKTPLEQKRRYFWSLLEDCHSLICKAIDRYSNLSTMVGIFTIEKIEKNIRETHDLLLPVLKEAKEHYPEYANEFFVLKNILRSLNDNLAMVFGIDLYSASKSNDNAYHSS